MIDLATSSAFAAFVSGYSLLDICRERDFVGKVFVGFETMLHDERIVLKGLFKTSNNHSIVMVDLDLDNINVRAQDSQVHKTCLNRCIKLILLLDMDAYNLADEGGGVHHVIPGGA